jgi:hypothetical protein
MTKSETMYEDELEDLNNKFKKIGGMNEEEEKPIKFVHMVD